MAKIPDQGLGARELFDVRDEFRGLDRIDKAALSDLAFPSLNCSHHRPGIERSVEFHGLEGAGVTGKPFVRRQAAG